ncbi:MAG TPA: PHB depolymerase family esterase, partial [Polyangia bacterium]|nr:PHB depolymerase family esterase [Polyangia bacterium]
MGILLLAAGCGSQTGAPDSDAGGSGSGGGSGSSSGGDVLDATSNGGGSSGAVGPENDDGGSGNEGSASDDGPGPVSADGSSCTGSPSTTSSLAGFLGDWSSGDYPPNFNSGDAGDPLGANANYLTISGVAGQMGNARQYAVHVPTGYSKDKPVPALFCLHGLAQNPVMFCLDTGVAWPTKGDQEGFVVIMPNGYMGSWNGGTCCGAAASDGLDDVALIRAIFAVVGTHVNIDLGRVYATGLSTGGYLSYRLACEASDLFVAVAPSAGAVGTAAIGGGTQATSDLAACTPTNKVSILDIHGTSDPLVPYSVQKPSTTIFQSLDGCSATTSAAA